MACQRSERCTTVAGREFGPFDCSQRCADPGQRMGPEGEAVRFAHPRDKRDTGRLRDAQRLIFDLGSCVVACVPRLPNTITLPFTTCCFSPPQHQVCAMQILKYVYVFGERVMDMARVLPPICVELLSCGLAFRTASLHMHVLARTQYRASLATLFVSRSYELQPDHQSHYLCLSVVSRRGDVWSCVMSLVQIQAEHLSSISGIQGPHPSIT